MPRAPKFIAVPAAALAAAPPNLYAGTSGWAYTSWKPGFYPAEVPTRAFLHHYAARFTSVEVNYTFRQLPTLTQLEDWLAATPPGFRFSFKAPQRITHFQRLRESHAAVAEFVECLAPVREAGKLGALLFQLPPNFAAHPERLADLLAAPALRETGDALAFEFRHTSWLCDEIYALLRAHNAALCVAESDELACPDVATATHRYYRLRCSGGYSTRKLGAFAAKFKALAQDGDVYVYLKHEDEPTGALNALSLLRRANALESKLPKAAR